MSARNSQLPIEAVHSLTTNVVGSEQRLVSIKSDITSTTSLNPRAARFKFPQTGSLAPLQGYLALDVEVSVAGGTTSLSLKNGVASAIKQINFYIGGTLVDSVDEYAVYDRKEFDLRHGDDDESNGMWVQGYDTAANRKVQQNAAGAGPHRYYIVPRIGLLKQPKLVELWGLPICELEVIFHNGYESIFITGTQAAGDFASFTNIEYFAEIHTMSQAYNDLAAKQIREGGLEIKFNTIESYSYNLSTGTNQTINVNSQAKSAKKLFFMQRTALNVANANKTLENVFLDDSLQDFQITMGTAVYPQQPIKVGAESWAELMKAMGKPLSHIRGTNVSQQEYQNTTTANTSKAYYGIDLERFQSSQHLSGIDLQRNKLSLNLRYSTAPAATANRLYVYVVRDNVLVIHPNNVFTVRF